MSLSHQNKTFKRKILLACVNITATAHAYSLPVVNEVYFVNNDNGDVTIKCRLTILYKISFGICSFLAQGIVTTNYRLRVLINYAGLANVAVCIHCLLKST